MSQFLTRSVSWRRVAIALAILFGFTALLEEWVGPFFVARSLAADQAAVLPFTLPDTTIATEPGTRVKRAGVSFEVPWVESETSRQRAGILSFANGVVILVFKAPTHLENVHAIKGFGGVALRQELGDGALNSEFALTAAAVATGADDAKWWRSPFYNQKVAFLLALKSAITGSTLPSQRVPIYRLSFGGIRGFQIGDPSGNQRAVQLTLFDNANRACIIEIWNFRSKVAQSQINAVVASLRFEE